MLYINSFFAKYDDVGQETENEWPLSNLDVFVTYAWPSGKFHQEVCRIKKKNQLCLMQ